MKIYYLLIIFLFAVNLSFGQNLTVEETIDYINDNIIESATLSLDNPGVLNFSIPTKDYDLNMSTNPFDYGYSAVGRGKTYEDYMKIIESKKSKITIHIADIENITLWNPNKQFNSYNPRVAGFKYLEEWATTIRCSKDEVYHIKEGDCISVDKDAQYRKSNFYTTYFHIQSKDGTKKSSEKIRNAFLYLLDLAKDKEYFSKEVDEDPFARENFNKNKFDIRSEVDSGVIKLTPENNVYFINISIGGFTKKFVLDSGASDVLISKEFERDLIAKDFIKKEHYLEDGLYQIADGSIIKCRRLLIPELVIGEFTLKNINATVNSTDTMLLGKSVLDKFSSWNINNLNKTLELNK